MKKKILALLTTFLLVCSLGAIGLTAGALDSSKQALVVTQVNTAQLTWEPYNSGASILVEINTNAYDSNIYSTTGQDQTYPTTYIEMFDAHGDAKEVYAEYCGSQVCINRNRSIEVGDTLTIKAGFTWGDFEAKEDQSFVFRAQGEPWVKLTSEYQISSISVQEENVQMRVGETSQIQWSFNPTTALGTPKFTSSDSNVLTVSDSGLVTANAQGNATVTISCKGITKVVSFSVIADTDNIFHVDEKYPLYHVPMAVAELDKTFSLLSQYPDLQYYYQTKSGNTAMQPVTESMIVSSTIDYTTAGTYAVQIKDPNSTQTDTINVRVFQLQKGGVFDTYGVHGYDANDTLALGEQQFTWSGHWIGAMNSFSTNHVRWRDAHHNTDNIDVQSETAESVCAEMSNYVEYTFANDYYSEKQGRQLVTAGTVYKNGNGNGGKIKLWILEAHFLVLITPNGASHTVGYGKEDRWNNTQVVAINDNEVPSGESFFPLYREGDTITFKKGMPIYKCTLEAGGVDHWWLEGMFMEDFTYVCTLDDGVDNKFEFTRKSDGFKVDESISVGKDNKVLLYHERTPNLATTGTFTFSSADQSIAKVSSLGYVTGVNYGSTDITVTLDFGDGRAPIVKTVRVTVTLSVKKCESNVFRIQQNDTSPDLSLYKINVIYSDGTTEQVALNDSRINITTKFRPTTVGRTLTIMGTFTEYGTVTTLRLKFEVVESVVNEDNANTGTPNTGGSGGSGNGSGSNNETETTGGGCGGSISAGGCLGLAILGLGFSLVKRKRKQ